MNLNKRAGVIAVLVLSLFIIPFGGSNEFQITTDTSNQYHPRIYGDTVVWHDERKGDWDIYVYNISIGKEFQVTSNESDQLFPAIYEDTIVWYDRRKGDSCYIYGYNLYTKREFSVADVKIRIEEVYSGLKPLEPYLAIYEDIVVWQDYRNGDWDIYGYDLSTDQEFPIAIERGDQFHVAIYKDVVVWGDNRNGNWDIYGYNISTRQIFPIESYDKDQRRPTIYGNVVVWEDNRNGNWDIYSYDLSTKKKFQITTDTSDQFHPAVYEDIVVWEDERNGNVDIYGYNLSMNQEFPIIIQGDVQYRPEIYGDVVVWFDRRNENSDIFGCDLSTIDNDGDGYPLFDDCDDNDPRTYPGGTEIYDGKDNDCDKKVDEGFDKDNDGNTGEFLITKNRSDQYHPKIYKNIVVWHDERNGDWNIYGYNLSTKKEFQITTDTSDQWFPAIYGDIIVWYESRSGNWDICGYDLSTNQMFTITPAEIKIGVPVELYLAIYGDIIVWENYRSGNWDICGYDLSAKKKFQITTDTSDQFHPAIYEDIVVWQDKRNGNWDIYSYSISRNELLQITSNPEDQQHPAIYGDYIVWEDKRNGNWDIYGCNLLTDQVFPITTDLNDQFHPAIYGDYIVWEDHRSFIKEESYICVYNHLTKDKVLITPNVGLHIRPEIYDGIVVWWDYRNGNPDIFGYCISSHDNDGDGYTECDGDCNDNDPQIYPGAQEHCGKDYNCDRYIELCTGNLEISVVDSQGQGLKAQVYVDGQHQGETDSAGMMTIPDLEADKVYMIRAEAEKYNPEGRTVKIEKNITEHLNIQMEKNIDLIYLLGGLLFSSLLLIILIYKLKDRSKKVTPKSVSPKSRSTQIFCPHCGNKIEKTWDSCLYCGYDLRDYTKVYDDGTQVY